MNDYVTQAFIQKMETYKEILKLMAEKKFHIRIIKKMETYKETLKLVDLAEKKFHIRTN